MMSDTDWDGWADDITTATITGQMGEASALQIVKAAFKIYGPDVPAQIIPGAARLSPLLGKVSPIGGQQMPDSSLSQIQILNRVYWRSDIAGWDVEFPMEKLHPLPWFRSARLNLSDARWKVVDLNTKSFTVECVGFSTLFNKTFNTQLPEKITAIKRLASERLRLRLGYPLLTDILEPWKGQ